MLLRTRLQSLRQRQLPLLLLILLQARGGHGSGHVARQFVDAPPQPGPSDQVALAPGGTAAPLGIALAPSRF